MENGCGFNAIKTSTRQKKEFCFIFSYFKGLFDFYSYDYKRRSKLKETLSCDPRDKNLLKTCIFFCQNWTTIMELTKSMSLMHGQSKQPGI